MDDEERIKRWRPRMEKANLAGEKPEGTAPVQRMIIELEISLRE